MPEVEGYIQRKSMLYKTGVEYGDYTINFVQEKVWASKNI